MPKYLSKNSTTKIGVNYVRSIVEKFNCIFQQIDTSNDIGIDAIMEIIKDEKPTCSFVAVQIKSGNSYYRKTGNLCKIPIKDHRSYWSKHPLPVYGIVFVPEFERAHWVDIKSYLKNYPDDTIITYEATLANLLTDKTFFTQFVPELLNDTPDISFEFAKILFTSEKQDEFFLGLYSLFKLFGDKNETWDLLVNYFKNNLPEKIPSMLIYYLAYIPWHGDIFYYKDTVTESSRKYGKTLISNFGVDEVLKLLSFVDEENMISRGSVGQSVEALISIIPNHNSYLEEIIKNDKISVKIREITAIIYAYYNGKNSLTLLKIFTRDSWYVQELIQYIEENGGIDPYL